MNRPGPNHPTEQKYLQDEQSWEFCTYAGHELAQIRRMASLTLAEKIGWLESAQEVVECLAKAGKLMRAKAALAGKHDVVRE